MRILVGAARGPRSQRTPILLAAPALLAVALAPSARADEHTEQETEARAKPPEPTKPDVMQRGPRAMAVLRDPEGKVVGRASLEETPNGVLIRLDASDLPEGPHAFHIHAVGKCEPPFESAGGHWNPEGRGHGYYDPHGKHAGDLPNVHVDERGDARVELFAGGTRLLGGKNAMLDEDGAALVVHEKPDDYHTDPAGAAGGRIACGVIELADMKDTTKEPTKEGDAPAP